VLTGGVVFLFVCLFVFDGDLQVFVLLQVKLGMVVSMGLNKR
jgi:hypothetical protein